MRCEQCGKETQSVVYTSLSKLKGMHEICRECYQEIEKRILEE